MGNEEQNISRPEITSDKEPVSILLGGLKRVEAPGDFDFRVKAGIAARKEASHASWVPGGVRWAVPLSTVVLLVAGYAGYNSYYLPDNTGMTAVNEFRTEPAPPVVPERDEMLISNASGPMVEEIVEAPAPLPMQTIAVEVARRTTPRRQDRTPPARGGGSFDEATGAGRTIFPRGVDPTGGVITAPTPEAKVMIQVNEVLSVLGIKAAPAQNGWTVDTITPNSQAERSGIKAGDVIEAINEQQLTEKTAFANSFNGKSLTVRRDGTIRKIDLRP